MKMLKIAFSSSILSMSVAQVRLNTSFEEEQLNTGDETGFIPRILMRQAWVIEI